MGSKGQSTQQQSQQQTYNPAGAGYVANALNQAQSAASLPFNIPQAPVAGFSQDQQNAFGAVRNAQGQAQPYYNQAASYFSPQGAQQFANPYIDSVTANLKDIFGQQNAQTTGQLTQAAGGVGADRIAVGQADLAKQQGLAAGQTYSQLYQNAAQQAQAAGYGTANLGQASQNSAFQGANQLLGTGGLQQQLQQAQLNAPYQQQLAQAAFPYQQAQFLAGITGALAPGLGGTTSGQSNTTSNPAQPSIWSQLLGAGVAGAGLYGGLGGSQSAYNPFASLASYGGGNAYTDAYGGSASNPLAGLSASDYAARGGVINPFADGGEVVWSPNSNPFNWQGHKPSNDDVPISIRFGTQPRNDNDRVRPVKAGGGELSDEPIDVSQAFKIPTSQIQPIQAHIPQLNFSQPQQSSGSSGGKGGGVGDIAKIAMMFANRGGAVEMPGAFARGGSPDDFLGLTNGDPAWADPDVGPGYAMPYAQPGSVADRGAFDYFGSGKPKTMDAYAATPDAVPLPRPRPVGAPAEDNSLPPIITGATGPRQTQALSFAGQPDDGALPANAEPTAGRGNPFAPAPNAPEGDAGQDFIKSPWAALTAAGLGIMGGTSPFAGVNIGQGGMQGLKTLETQRTDAQKDTTIAQAAKRLEQEAKFHEDQFSRETVGQRNQRLQADRPYSELTAAQRQAAERQARLDDLAEKRFNRPYEELTKAEQATLEENRRAHDMARIPPGFQQKADGTPGLEPIPGGPHSPEQIKGEADAKRLPAMSREDMTPLVEAYLAGDHSVMNGIGRGTQGPQNIQQFWNMTAEKLAAQGKTGAQIAAAKANFMGQTAALRTAAQREANIDIAVNEAKGTFPEVLRTSANLPRTEFVPFNKALEFYRTQTGSPEQRQYGAAIQASITAYSQAMSRTGANSVYAQQHAAEVLSRADGPEALKSSIKQLETEMHIAKAAPEETRQGILNRILDRPIDEKGGPTTPGATAAPAIPDAAKAQLKEGQITTFGNGQKWTLKNGQPSQVP